MNAKQIGLSVLLVDFLGLTAYAAYQYGYLGVFELVMANAATMVVFVDLVIALSIIMTWMVRDARERGISAVPYVVLTLALGSVGPLTYLIRRAAHQHPAVATASLAAAGGRHA
jgi:hypothetical protein